MNVHVYTVCWNEALLLPYFLRHYETIASKIVVFDNMSTDGSRDLIARHPLCELRSFDSQNEFRDDMHMEFKNNAWKESRGIADWVIVCDLDEFLWHPHLDEYLHRCMQAGITFPTIYGYQMISETLPTTHAQLYEEVRLGMLNTGYSKHCIFDPVAITDVHYANGCHYASPEGTIYTEAVPSLALLHFKYLSLDYRLERHALYESRRGTIMKENDWGSFYQHNEHTCLEFEHTRAHAIDIITAMCAQSLCDPEPIFISRMLMSKTINTCLPHDAFTFSNLRDHQSHFAAVSEMLATPDDKELFDRMIEQRKLLPSPTTERCWISSKGQDKYREVICFPAISTILLCGIGDGRHAQWYIDHLPLCRIFGVEPYVIDGIRHRFRSYEEAQKPTVLSCSLASRTNGSLRQYSLDDFVAQTSLTFDFLLIETGGTEQDIIRGATDTLQTQRPQLAVSISHKKEDLFEIPLLLHSILSKYTYHIAHYGAPYNDPVLYAIPAEIPSRTREMALTKNAER